MFFHLILLIIYNIFVLNVNAVCNTCGASGVACISEKQFKTCSGGIVSGTTIHECPVETICVASDAHICVSTVAGVPIPSCEICNVCTPDLRFACITETEYAYCFGSTTPSTVTDVCPTSSVCDINAIPPNFCSTATDVAVCLLETAEPPPVTTVPPTTTTPTPTDQCIAYGRVGRYVLAGTACKKYIYCYLFNSKLLGTIYTCSGATLFDNAIGMCVEPTFVCTE